MRLLMSLKLRFPEEKNDNVLTDLGLTNPPSNPM